MALVCCAVSLEEHQISHLSQCSCSSLLSGVDYSGWELPDKYSKRSARRSRAGEDPKVTPRVRKVSGGCFTFVAVVALLYECMRLFWVAFPLLTTVKRLSSYDSVPVEKCHVSLARFS